jgi:hypothetical protein
VKRPVWSRPQPGGPRLARHARAHARRREPSQGPIPRPAIAGRGPRHRHVDGRDRGIHGLGPVRHTRDERAAEHHPIGFPAEGGGSVPGERRPRQASSGIGTSRPAA